MFSPVLFVNHAEYTCIIVCVGCIFVHLTHNYVGLPPRLIGCSMCLSYVMGVLIIVMSSLMRQSW